MTPFKFMERNVQLLNILNDLFPAYFNNSFEQFLY